MEDIQRLIFAYFEGTPNIVYAAFVDSFVYGEPASPGTSKLIEKFLADMDLTQEYLNYQEDIRDPKLFRRSSLSSVGLINDIFYAILSLSHNRLRRLV